MPVETIPAPPRSAGAAAFYWKLASGPAAFGLILLLPIGLVYQGRLCLATFACAVAWWITRPVPWAIAALLPMVVFPATGVMSIGATTELYGHPIFFWIMGTVLVGYAIQKHGLAQRFALAFLSIPGVAGRTRRLTFVYMFATGLISMFVSDAATIAMMIPIGMSIVRHIRTIAAERPAPDGGNFAAFMTLATFYAAVAGGTGTLVGIPHNAIAVSLLERLSGRSLSWFGWMTAGVPIFLGLLISAYVVLWMMVPPEVRQIPSGEAFLQAERARIGPITSNERRVLVVFAAMVLLFTLPAITGLALGGTHAVSQVVDRALPIWVVPPAILLLLFTIRSADSSGDALLSWKDAEEHSPWNVMILVLGAVAMTEALTKFGFVEFMGSIVQHLGLSRLALPYAAALIAAVSTNFISGTAATALYCSIFVPAATNLGFNPASMAMLIANVGLGIALPWAGAAAATAFAVGEIEMGRMIKIGTVATAVFIVVIGTIHVLLAPFV